MASYKLLLLPIALLAATVQTAWGCKCAEPVFSRWTARADIIFSGQVLQRKVAYPYGFSGFYERYIYGYYEDYFYEILPTKIYRGKKENLITIRSSANSCQIKLEPGQKLVIYTSFWKELSNCSSLVVYDIAPEVKQLDAYFTNNS